MTTTKKTERGFQYREFTDGNGVECSVQVSSAYRGDNALLWLGCNKPNPRAMVQGAGWQSVPLPEGTLCDTRMHLTREQVKELVAVLKVWLKEGRL